MEKIKLIVLLIISSVIYGCTPENPKPDPIPVSNTDAIGAYVLCEGIFNMNNSTLVYYDFKSGIVSDDLFLEINNRGLGDTGNDLKQYGSKLYCVVNISSQIEVMDVNSVRSIKQISLANRQPRYIAFFEDKAYVSCYDGSVIKLDTTTLEIEGIATAGSNPEGLCVANGKLYVANSGGLNYPNYGNTVSVFDLTTFTKIKDITVGVNPYSIKSDFQGDVYLVSRGNYGNIPYSFQRIDSQIDEVVQNFDMEVLNFTISGNYAYLYNYDYSSQTSWIKVMDITTETTVKENLISDGTDIDIPYGIAVNPVNGDIYIADANDFVSNGDVFCFDKNGNKKFSFEVGLNPNSLVIRVKNKAKLLSFN